MTPPVHLPSVLGRARADRGPLLLAALVLALGALLACGIPAAAARAADDAMHAAVARAGDSAALVATVPFPDTPDSVAGQREPASAALTDASFRDTRLALPPDLAGVLRTPIARVTTDPLEVLGHVAGRSLVLAYVTAQTGDPRVVWTAGRPPAASPPPTPTHLARPGSPPPKRVEAGLSQAAARALGVRAGSRIGAQDDRHEQLDLLVSGVYRVSDPRDRVWAAVPHLLEPASFSDGAGQHYLAATALLSRDSLPDARIAIDEDLLTSQVVYPADPSRIGTSNADAVVDGIAQLQAAASDVLPDDARWATNLDAVVRAGQRQVAAAEGQSAALLAGLVTAAALVTALAADLLVRRRAPALGLARVRGASLPGLGLELAVESIVLAFAGTAAGALVALALGGQAAGAWLLPLAAVGVLAAPLTGMRAASAAGGDGRRAPANRGARAALERVRRARVLALEVAVGAGAVGAFVALHQRGTAEPDLLAAAAPALGAVVSALLLRRALPAGARVALHRAARSPRAVPLVVAARIGGGSAALLPFVVVAVSTALLGLTAATGASADGGRDMAAWQAVGGDVRLQAPASPSLAGVAARLGRQPGVRAVVAARVDDGFAVSGDAGGGQVRLVVVDAAAYRRLLSGTPLPVPAALSSLGAGGSGLPGLPALLRTSQPTLLASRELRVTGGGRETPLRVVGTAPVLGNDADDVLVLDTAAAAAAGLDTAPNTLWVVGPQAATAVASLHVGTVTTREQVRSALAAEPVAAALRRLVAGATLVLVAFGVLGVVLGAAASARDRGETLARLRTLGLRRRAAAGAIVAELLPTTLVAALGGLFAGVLLARLSIGPLALGLVTGGSDPPLVVPWWTVIPGLIVVAAVPVVVAVEMSLRRRERLGLVLRAGT